MTIIASLLQARGLADPLPDEDAARLAEALGAVLGQTAYPRSLAAADACIFCLLRSGRNKHLAIITSADRDAPQGFRGEARSVELEGRALRVRVCPTDHANASALRRALPFMAPRVMGLKRAAGLGDRLGLATPGHVRAVRGSGMAPFFAQQSIREMTRTRRTPDQVMDSATWGVFQEGWREGFGSDADHLKNTDDIDATAAAGFTMFTVDPGDHVDNEADVDEAAALQDKFDRLPWDALEGSAADCRRLYVGQAFLPADGRQTGMSGPRVDEETLLRAMVKYGRAVAHTAAMYRHLVAEMGDRPFELEMSVDETETPTTIAEHFLVASELQRLGVKWVSLAPRFVGRFEKGVDYIGDLVDLERTFAQHALVARRFGPYKISLHSGSDKFSVYPIAARTCGDLVHLKTAGTSYLEALRAIAGVAPGLFREILAFAFECYPEDKATYHVSADIGRVLQPDQLKDADLASVLDLFDGRQLLHVTFGSVLTWQSEDGGFRFRDRVLAALMDNEEAHYDALERHLRRHVEPFV